MRRSRQWAGAELFLGAVYGLGMSAAVWIPMNAGSFADWRLVLLCLAASCAGLSRSWTGWPAPASLPWIVVGWQLAGPAPALLIAVIAAGASRLLSGRRRVPARLAFDAGAAALAVVAATGVATRFTGSTVAFASLFVFVSIALHSFRRQLAGIAPRRLARDLGLSFGWLICSVLGAFAITWIWVESSYRPLLLVAPALRLGWIAGSRFSAARRRRRRSGQPRATERLRDRVAAALAQAQPEGGAGGHLWRTAALCNAIGERLGTDPDEMRYLGHAALLHHAGRLAHMNEPIGIHPRVVEETVTQLGFAAPVRTILREMHEHWDGSGPGRRRGERIERGARILAIADSYDRAAHDPPAPRNHAAVIASLRGESGQRFDPLMFEILDELSGKLEATGCDLTRRFDLAQRRSAAGARLTDGDRELQTLYSIKRAAELPIGLRERWTLIAGLLRRVVPFSHLRIECDGDSSFFYGDHAAGPAEESFDLVHNNRAVGRLVLGLPRDRDSEGTMRERVRRVTTILAGTLARERESQLAVSLTDPETGLPNARFLRRTLALRIPPQGNAGPGLGLIALHLRTAKGHTPIAEVLLKTIAGRFASACDERETLVRFGPEQFIVVCSESRGGELVRRRHQLVGDALAQPIEIAGRAVRVQVDGAHAAHPIDGETLEELLSSLEARLTCSESASVVPFRKRQAG